MAPANLPSSLTLPPSIFVYVPLWMAQAFSMSIVQSYGPDAPLSPVLA